MTETTIAGLRRARGWTQERLAQESGVAPRTIQRLEAGREAGLETLSRIAAALDVSVEQLQEPVPDGPEPAVARQQRRRDEIGRNIRRLGQGLAIVVTLTVFVLISARVLPEYGLFIIPAWWLFGRRLVTLLIELVAEPWLDRRFPQTAGTLPD